MSKDGQLEWWDDDDDDDDEKPDEPLDLDAVVVRGAGVRNTDPKTSRGAVPGRVGRIAAAVLLRLYSAQATDERLLADVRVEMGCSESSPRKRRGELERTGFVRAVGEATSEFGKPMLVWGLSPAGIEYVIEHREALVELKGKRPRGMGGTA